MIKYSTFVFLLLLVACSGASDSENASTETATLNNYPPLLQEIWEAHGGMAPWQKYKALSYDLMNREASAPETHRINLNDRRVRIEAPQFTLGMDGEQVWVSPSLEAVGDMSPRFYHNLMFYFFGIPFLMADPGVNYEDLGTKTLNGREYRALRIYFDQGTGDADNDEYILLANPESKRLEWVLYTVTYFSGEKTQNYNALKYGQWQQAGDLLVPEKLTGYQYASDTLGEVRYEMNFSNVTFSEQSYPDTVFTRPEGAVFAD